MKDRYGGKSGSRTSFPKGPPNNLGSTRGPKAENRRRTERDIYAGKGGSLTAIMRWNAVILKAQVGSREEISNKGCMWRSYRVTTEGMAQVKVSKEKKRRRKLPNQGDLIIVGDPSSWGEVHRADGIRTAKGKTNRTVCN